MLGRPFEDDFISFLKKERYFLNEFVSDDRGLVGFKVSRKEEGTNEKLEDILYNEELIAMLLKTGKQFAEKQAGVSIKDAVITIPSWFTHQQRRMMVDASELAGLSALQLIHENTAVATMYGIDRLDTDAAHTVLFYNMGGVDTEVSIVRYSTITDPATNKTYEHIDIIAEAFEKNLGGYDLDIILVNMLAEQFNTLKERQGQPDIRSYPRTLKRLFKEVVKIKDILSSNKFMQVKLSELQDYVSLFTTIQRKEFENAAQSFFDRVLDPIDKALVQAGLSIEQVDQVEIVGGGVRVPKV